MRIVTETRPASDVHQFDKVVHNNRLFTVLTTGDTTQTHKSFQLRDKFIGTTTQVKFELDTPVDVVVG